MVKTRLIKFNPTKTNILFFGNTIDKNHVNLSFHSAQPKVCDLLKHPRITFSDDCKWHSFNIVLSM